MKKKQWKSQVVVGILGFWSKTKKPQHQYKLQLVKNYEIVTTNNRMIQKKTTSNKINCQHDQSTSRLQEKGEDLFPLPFDHCFAQYRNIQLKGK